MTTTFHVGTRGMGVPLMAPPTIAEALQITGLNWDVKLEETYSNIKGREVKLPARSVVRQDTGDVLGVVGMKYGALQNSDAFNFFQPYLDDGSMTLESGGSLSNGKKVFVLAKINVDPKDVVAGDPVQLYSMLSNSHDGTLSIRTGFTPFRGTCCNMLGYVHSLKDSKFLRVRHTANAVKALDKIREAMNLAKRNFEATVSDYRAMARYGVLEKDLQTYVTRVFKPEVIQGSSFADIKDEAAKKKAQKMVDKIIPLFESGRGNDMAGVRGTLWGAFNAVTEYTTHERGRSKDTRLISLFYGDSVNVNRRALLVAQQMMATG